MRQGIIAILSLLSVGWLAPLWLAVNYLITWAEHEELGVHSQHSFPYLSAARDAFGIGGAWLTVVMLFWSLIVGRMVITTKSTQ
jgi:hypothetical protein